MKRDKPSSEWKTSNVLARLKAKVGKDKKVSAQVFLHDDVSSENLSEVAKEILAAAQGRPGGTATAELGKVHRLAKSFSLTADVDTLAAVASAPNVKTILPSEVDDVFPRPVKVSPT